jgi:hypothetical protein
VAEDAVVEQAGARREATSAAADDEAVDQQHHFRFGRGQHGADHHGDLEAAELGQHVNGSLSPPPLR